LINPKYVWNRNAKRFHTYMCGRIAHIVSCYILVLYISINTISINVWNRLIVLIPIVLILIVLILIVLILARDYARMCERERKREGARE